ncbi:MAG TPA: hypothetical protein PLM14_02915 [Candidatus Hydrogenedentes bacterium]|nr:hypothetical protein [Candidatus Hydrogenedentota bacterium]HQH54450.1 hypothetical protein [Candidatus Hydrogenedentota bacterium]
MHRIAWLILFAGIVGMPCAAAESGHERALARQDDLRLGVYLTAGAVDGVFEARSASVELLREYGFTRVILEVYRSGHVVPPEHLAGVRDYFRDNGFDVAGGIATTPGGGVGVPQEGPLSWYNWQNRKTRHDLERIMRSAAPLFDVFVIDDFLCTGDLSQESVAAKGELPWDKYRCGLMAAVAQEVFIAPAKQENPGITMIVKFPQWYDLFHLHGYDVDQHAAQFDRVWVGTETRGARTQRYGFVQPYEGFVNYRWLASIAPEKTECAWFDHGDCDALDFVDQAYQSVLAGARNICVFNYSDVVGGHPGCALLAQQFEQLADLAAAVRLDPVWGIPAYKPSGSDAGGDVYLMDFIGMLGVPLVPTAAFPSQARSLFLPAQAAADPEILGKLQTHLASGGRAILTAGFLSRVPDAADAAGVKPTLLEPLKASAILLDGESVPVRHGLDLAGRLDAAQAEVLLEAICNDSAVPFLTRHRAQGGEVAVLNCHTFSQADFDAVGEVLLAPRRLGLLELPQTVANQLRAVFIQPLDLAMEAPARVTLQPFGERSLFVQNYNEEPVSILLRPVLQESGIMYRDRFTGETVPLTGGCLHFEVGSRARRWLEAQ